MQHHPICCLVIAAGCLMGSEARAESLADDARQGVSAKRSRSPRRSSSRSKPVPLETLVAEQRELERKLAPIEKKLGKDGEVAANRKIFTDVIRKKAQAIDPDYAKVRAELATLREKVRRLQARVTKVERQVAADPAVAELSKEVDRLVTEKGNKINPNYGKWKQRHDEVSKRIRQARQKRMHKKSASRPSRVSRKKPVATSRSEFK